MSVVLRQRPEIERFVDPFDTVMPEIVFHPQVGIVVPRMSVAEEHALVDRLEEDMTLYLDLAELKPVHRFGPGVYMRELTIPTGTLLTGEIHRTEHFCIVSKGLISVWTAGEGVRWIEGPATFLSRPGARRVGWALQETVWTTVHPTTLTNLEEIEKEIFQKRPSPMDRVRAREITFPVTDSVAADREDYAHFLEEYDLTRDVVTTLVENEADQMVMPQDVDTIELRDSPIDGQGMFFTRDLVEGTFIAPARLSGKRTPAGRYVNHSARPNAHFLALPNGDLIAKTLVAVRCDEEVLIDYRQAMSVNGAGLKPVRRITS